MKVITLFLQYDTDKYPSAIEYFKKYLSNITYDNQLIVIDNKINGDNSLWEFSGWQKYVDLIRKEDLEYDAIIFANDSFLAPAGSMVGLEKILSDEALEASVKYTSIVGAFAGAGFNGVIDGYYIPDYVRTHCFIIPRYLIEKIGTVVSVGTDFIDKCLREDCSYPYFKKDAPVCKSTQHMWLTHLKERWHSKSSLFLEDGSFNKELFRMKTLAFFNECLLTARCREQKYIELPELKEV